MKSLITFFLAAVVMSCNTNAQKKPAENSKQYKVSKTENEWKEQLTSAQFAVLRNAATEPPHSSKLNLVEEPGVFVCAACGNELYETRHKFESGTGWPSFDRAVEGGVAYGSDTKLGFQRDEVHCADCGGHLGHIFDDGPRETTGKRHCINGVAMNFVPKSKENK